MIHQVGIKLISCKIKASFDKYTSCYISGPSQISLHLQYITLQIYSPLSRTKKPNHHIASPSSFRSLSHLHFHTTINSQRYSSRTQIIIHSNLPNLHQPSISCPFTPTSPSSSFTLPFPTHPPPRALTLSRHHTRHPNSSMNHQVNFKYLQQPTQPHKEYHNPLYKAIITNIRAYVCLRPGSGIPALCMGTTHPQLHPTLPRPVASPHSPIDTLAQLVCHLSTQFPHFSNTLSL